MASRKQKPGPHSKVYQAVNEYALRFPGAYEEFPWGHSAIKVNKKIFISMGETDEGFSMSLKLTDSNFEALLLPFTEPTHYGMGKHGWVSSRFAPKAKPPLALLKAWIEESYRAIAPKKRIAELDAEGLAAPSGSSSGERVAKKKPATRKKAASKKPAARKKSTRKPAARKKPAGRKGAGRKKA